MPFSRDTELRHVPPVSLLPLTRALEENECWKQLMAHIADEPHNPAGARPKYGQRDVALIEVAAAAPGDRRRCAEILLEEWATSGRRRPTVIDLVETLKRSVLYRAADVASTHLLDEPPVERPANGPAARVDLRILSQLADDDVVGSSRIESYLEAAPYPESIDNVEERTFAANLDRPERPKRRKELNKSKSETTARSEEASTARVAVSSSPDPIPDFSALLEKVESVALETNDSEAFQCEPPMLSALLSAGGSSINESSPVIITTESSYNSDSNPPDDVFACPVPTNVTDADVDRFFADAAFLIGSEHENIVPLIRHTTGGSDRYIFYERREGKTLRQAIADNGLLDPASRLRTAKGIARGLEHLHCREPPFAHGSLSSANVLMAGGDTPKLYNFAVTKRSSTYGPISTDDSDDTSSSVAECHSPKADIYNYGIILLELLTGLPPHDAKRTTKDIADSMSSANGVDSKVDKRAGEWSSAIDFYAIANKCLHADPEERPHVLDIIEDLNNYECNSM